MSVKTLYNRNKSFGLTARDGANAHVYKHSQIDELYGDFLCYDLPLIELGFYVLQNDPPKAACGQRTTSHRYEKNEKKKEKKIRLVLRIYGCYFSAAGLKKAFACSARLCDKLFKRRIHGPPPKKSFYVYQLIVTSLLPSPFGILQEFVFEVF